MTGFFSTATGSSAHWGPSLSEDHVSDGSGSLLETAGICPVPDSVQ